MNETTKGQADTTKATQVFICGALSSILVQHPASSSNTRPSEYVGCSRPSAEPYKPPTPVKDKHHRRKARSSWLRLEVLE